PRPGLSAQPSRPRRVVRHRRLPWQRRRHRPGGDGLHVLRGPAGARPARPRRARRYQVHPRQGERARPQPPLPAQSGPPPTSPHGPMYGHGFATLFLREAYGMVHAKLLREEMRAKLRLAVNLILSAQRFNDEKAWRYEPTSRDADLSVTICQIMALRSARNAG